VKSFFILVAKNATVWNYSAVTWRLRQASRCRGDVNNDWRRRLFTFKLCSGSHSCV